MKTKDILGWLALIFCGIWIAYGLNREHQVKIRAKFTVAKIIKVDLGKSKAIHLEYLVNNEIFTQRISLMNSPYPAASYNVGDKIVAIYDSLNIGAAAAVFDAFIDPNLDFGTNINYYSPAALDTLNVSW